MTRIASFTNVDFYLIPPCRGDNKGSLLAEGCKQNAKGAVFWRATEVFRLVLFQIGTSLTLQNTNTLYMCTHMHTWICDLCCIDYIYLAHTFCVSFTLKIHPVCRHWPWMQSSTLNDSSCRNGKKKNLLLGNECACMDKHVHAKSNVNTAIVYDTHAHTHTHTHGGTQVTSQTKPGA